MTTFSAAKYFIGCQSGTSMDACDVGIFDFSSIVPRLIFAKAYTFAEDLKQQLKIVIQNQQAALQEIGELDIKLALFFAESINDAVDSAKLKSSDIHAIGFHGQTLFHSPNSEFPFTWQIGDSNIVAEKTSIPVVGDLRRRNMAAGGQGAPFAPAFHAHVFHNEQEDRAIVNIGGIANISLLKQDGSYYGFDTGPGNVLIDAWIQQQLDMAHDENGAWGQAGCLHNDLFNLCIADPYFKAAAPKSTGREYFNINWLKNALAQLPASIADNDVQATLHHLTANSISNALKEHLPHAKRLIVCGGGGHNQFLISLLKDYCRCEVDISNNYGLDMDWVEVALFAWIAQENLSAKTIDLMQTTGARENVVLGAIYQ